MLRLCEVIEVNRSSFYAWDAAAPARAEKAAGDAELAERIRLVHEADKAYATPRITAELNDAALPRLSQAMCRAHRLVSRQRAG